MIIGKKVENPTLRVISLGAGVQSSVMALMASKGEISDIPDAAIFADTQAEPKLVYDHLNWLEKNLQFPVFRVTAGSLLETVLTGIQPDGHHFTPVPFFIENAGIGRRQCTSIFKIEPVRKKIRELLGVNKGKKVPADVIVEQWIGISIDEIGRAKDSRDKWCYNRWPLIEKEMTRQNCIDWFNKNYPDKTLPRSACFFCPYQSNKEFRSLKDNDEHSWQLALEVDKKIREANKDKKQFVHRSCKPLDEIDLMTEEEKGQINWLDECDGMCGV
tara:strand:+ start:133 stop:951 length:819 start_codon:yes stop_codon:yes gene_type:complete